MKKKKPIIFIQSIDIYEQDLVVVCDAGKEEIIRYLKKVKCKKPFIDWIEKDNGIFDVLKTNKAVFCWNDEIRGKIIMLKNFGDTWEFWQILMHELHHFIHNFSLEKMMEKEMEAQAYLFEFLFRSIRRKLQGIDKI